MSCRRGSPARSHRRRRPYQPSGARARPSTYSQMRLMRPAERRTRCTRRSRARSRRCGRAAMALHRTAVPVAALQHLVAHARHPLEKRPQHLQPALAVECPPRGVGPEAHLRVVEPGDGVHVPCGDGREQAVEQLLGGHGPATATSAPGHAPSATRCTLSRIARDAPAGRGRCSSGWPPRSSARTCPQRRARRTWPCA